MVGAELKSTATELVQSGVWTGVRLMLQRERPQRPGSAASSPSTPGGPGMPGAPAVPGVPDRETGKVAGRLYG